MIIFYSILAVYILSVVAIYFIARFMYITHNPKGPIPPMYWIIPVMNTLLVLVGFVLCAKDIPVLGSEYWTRIWERQLERKKNKETKTL